MKPGSGCASGVLGVLAIVVAVVVVISLPAALVAHDIGQVVFSKDKVTQIVGNQIADSNEIRQMLVTSFLSNPAPEDTNPSGFNLARAAERLSPEQTVELTNLLLPQEWFREQIASVVGGLYDWLDGDQPRPEMMLDLRSLKERLLNGGARRLLELLVGSWPPCLPGQLSQIDQALSRNRPPPILYCKATGSFEAAYLEQSTAWFTNQVRAMPDTISLTGERPVSPADTNLAFLRDRLRLAREVMRFGWMIPASLFGVMMALAVRSWVGLSRWWGASLAATGLASLVPILFARPLQTRLLGQIRPGLAIPPVLFDALTSAAGGIRSDVVQALAAQAILMIVAGAGLLIGGWLSARRHGGSQAPSAVAAVMNQPQSGPTDGSEERPSGIFG